ncbi:MAG: sigma-54-dependent Fis family transcriptional regulator [Deltaproteobacteria bacterium]|nr:sigma-54-dependent Fis family transcriptional regulator [Deltaproteobacteria bacterium]
MVNFVFPGVMGVSPRMQEVQRLLELVAPAEATVLLLGETGTGKELAAQAIHLNSPRGQGPFVLVNCAALPETLLESELFGHEKGAFTGATARKQGRFLLAHQGSLFLDEIGELKPVTQAKILRVLQSREFEPLGSNRTVKVDVRIIAATNRDLQAMVHAGSFRDDLYFRLNVFPVHLPPLRERQEDLPLLADHFLRHFAEKYRREVTAMAPEALLAFQNYPWPGNIRELANVLEWSVIVCQGRTLHLQDLPGHLQRYAWAPAAAEGEPTLAELERQLIIRTLEKMGHDRGQAAAVLGIPLEELNLKMRTYGLEG